MWADMSDFFDTDENEKPGSRLENLSVERARRRRYLLIAALVLVLIAALVSGAVIMIKLLPGKTASRSEAAKVATKNTPVKHNPKSNKPSEGTGTAGNSQESSQTPSIKPVSNVLIVGVQNVNGKKIAKGLLIARIDLEKGAIQAVNIPDRTYLNVSGLGMDQISQSFNMGVASTKKTLEELLHVQADSHIVIHYEDFELLVSNNLFSAAFDKAVETSLFEVDKKAYSTALAKINPSKINILPLPVKFMSLNGEPFYEPDNQEISRLVATVWGIKIEIKEEPIRVIILNGSGQPGVGKQVSDKLTPNGFVVIDIRNASSFNYKQTQIVAYKQQFMQQAEKIKQLVGVGNVVHHQVNQDVAELAIIIGQDLKPAP